MSLPHELLRAATAHPVDAIYLGLNGRTPTCVSVAEETPVAFRYNGFPHGVMMATPADVEDFAIGFSLTDGIIETTAEITRMVVTGRDDGILVDISLDAITFHRYLAGRRIRQSRGQTSCGLCGVEDLKDVRRPASGVGVGYSLDPTVVRSAADALRAIQPLSRSTRAAHASAWVSTAGAIEAVREDVGRHNSLDKLIGAGLRGAFSPKDGFCLITSRCSFEMAQKAIAAGYTTLVSISAPTALAIRSAAAAGLTLYSLSGDAGQFLYAGPLLSEEVTHGIET